MIDGKLVEEMTQRATPNSLMSKWIQQ